MGHLRSWMEIGPDIPVKGYGRPKMRVGLVAADSGKPTKTPRRAAPPTLAIASIPDSDPFASPSIGVRPLCRLPGCAMNITFHRCPGSADTLAPGTAARDLIQLYLRGSRRSVDPFARNCTLADRTNDIDPTTWATDHQDAPAWLAKELAGEPIPDLLIIDPPFSETQAVRKYDAPVRPLCQLRAELAGAITRAATPGLLVLWFAWNSVGLLDSPAFAREALHIICHGSVRPDTHIAVDRCIIGPLRPPPAPAASVNPSRLPPSGGI